MIGVLLDMEAYMGISLVEVLREFVLFSFPSQYYEIAGGMDQLPKSFVPILKKNIHFHQKMAQISQYKDQVKVQCKHQKTSMQSSFIGDLAIVAIPFSTLRFVKIEPFESFSYYKRRAIRELNYMVLPKLR
jgi:monoamine oxidase